MGSKNSKQLATSVPTDKPSRVMNEDIVIIILSNLSVKQLIQLQCGSQQLLICVPMALKLKKMLSIGDQLIQNTDITKAIVRLEVIEREDYKTKTVQFWYDLTASHPMMLSIVGMCPRIQSLHLMQSIVDYPSIALIINECPRLTSLSMNETKIHGLDATTIPQWTQLMAPRLTQWALRCVSQKSSQNLMNILSGLSSLQELSLDIESDSDDDEDIIDVLDHIPAGVRRIKLNVDSLSQILSSVAPFISRCGPHLESLDIRTLFAVQESADQFFSAVYDGCPALKRLAMHSNTLTENISKLKNLSHLELKSLGNIDTNAFKPMPSLQTVCLNCCDIRSTQWTRLANIWPNVRRLSVSLRGVVCECGQDHHPCHQSMTQYLQCLSYLPRITRLDLLHSLHVIGGQHLHPFIELKTLSFKDYGFIEYLPQLISFIEYCEDNRVNKTPLKLVVSKGLADLLVNRFQEMGANEWQSIRLHWY